MGGRGRIKGRTSKSRGEQRNTRSLVSATEETFRSGTKRAGLLFELASYYEKKIREKEIIDFLSQSDQNEGKVNPLVTLSHYLSFTHPQDVYLN